MFFRTRSECEALASGYGYDCDVAHNRIVYQQRPFPHAVTLGFSGALDRSYALAGQIATWCGPFERLVLWVTEWSIWPSSENLHLYYTVRRASGDFRELAEAPGHVFLKHEQADLVTFLDLTIRFGWGGFLFGYPQSAAMILSHDEWLRVATDGPIAPILQSAEHFGLKVLDQTEGDPG